MSNRDYLQEYETRHFRFVRNSGLRGSDFAPGERPAWQGYAVALGLALLMLVAWGMMG